MSICALSLRSPAPRLLYHCSALLAVVALGISTSGCTSFLPNTENWSMAGIMPEKAPVGSPSWWKKNKKKASFEPFKGYVLDGTSRKFDANGNPIDQPVQRIGTEEEEVGLFPGLDPVVTIDKVKKVLGNSENQEEGKIRFAKAETLFADKNYFNATWQYRKAASLWPQSKIEEDSLFMIAESYFFADRYDKARDAYNGLISKYPNSRHLNQLIERQWQIAQYWENEYFDGIKVPLTPNAIDKTKPTFDTIGHAIKTYENIRLNDPTGPRADDAILATAGIHFRRKRFEDADYNYTLLRREYPRSELQFEAHLLGLQAKLHMYQGPDYDGKSLEDAKKLASQLRRQFAGQLSAEERERLRTVQGELNLQIAQRDINLAQNYYEKKKEYRSARQLYTDLIQRLPNSEVAKLASERLAQISDQPDEPAERMAWFTNLFPESREIKRVARIPELKDGKTLIAKEPNGKNEPDSPVSTGSAITR